MRAVGLLLLSGCSLLVAPEDVPLRCADDDACPVRMECRDFVCVTGQDGGDGDSDSDSDADGDGDPDCDPGDEELCNGRDDDCDGETDEGHDLDDDGVTWCNGGREDGRDCDDQDPDETPGRAEECDGHDNDCNGEVDDGACPDGALCEPASGQCSTRDCRDDGCDPGSVCQEEDGAFRCVASENPDDCRDGDACPDGEVCNQLDGQCTPAGELGEECRIGSECAEALCVSPASLRMADGERFCSRTCCTRADCPAGFVCWQPGSGFSACVARDRLGLGGGDAGEGDDCSTDSDCASGQCRGSSCAEPCCLDDDCGGDSCTIDLDYDEDIADVSCASGGLLGPGWSCEVDEDCASNLCIDTGYCTAPCCQSADCDDGMVCAYARLVDLDTEPFVRLCLSDSGWAGPNHGEEPAGAACLDGSDCRSDRCEDDRCVDACCSAADCPDGTTCQLREVLGGGEQLCL